jgi:hypothetical protein
MIFPQVAHRHFINACIRFIRYKDDRRLKSDSKAEDDPFKLLGLKQGASASQVRCHAGMHHSHSIMNCHISIFDAAASAVNKRCVCGSFFNNPPGESRVQEAIVAAAS